MSPTAIVMGGGPAGSTAALALARAGHSALLIERSRYENWRAGETLPPRIQLILRWLGVWERFQEAAHDQSCAIHSAWGDSELYEKDFVFDPYGSGWHVDRRRFDAMLASAAEEAGVTVLRGARAQWSWRNDRWQVAASAGNDCVEAEAPFLVDATGPAARVARSCGTTRRTADRLVGVVGLLKPEPGAGPVNRVLLLEAAEDGWWYSAPLPGGALVVAYMTDEDAVAGRPGELWREKLPAARHTAARVEGFRLDGFHVRTARTGRLDAMAGPGWIAVGDAASSYDPLSAAGIYKALESAAMAAESIGRTLAGDAGAFREYSAELERQFVQYLDHRAHYYNREKRWPASRFWRRRHG